MWWVQTKCPGTSGQGGVDRPRFSPRVTHSWPSQQGPPALTLTPTWGTSWWIRSPNLTRLGPPSFVLPLGLPAAVAGCVPENQEQRYGPRLSLANSLPTPKSTNRKQPRPTPEHPKYWELPGVPSHSCFLGCFPTTNGARGPTPH